MPGAAIVSAGGAQTFATLRNNAHHNWWQDAGMRKLTIGIAAGFCGTVNAGYDGSLFNGLQTMPIFMEAIGQIAHPDASRLGIISAASHR